MQDKKSVYSFDNNLVAFNTFVLPKRYDSVSSSRCSKTTRAAFSGVIGGFSLATHRIWYLCWFYMCTYVCFGFFLNKRNVCCVKKNYTNLDGVKTTNGIQKGFKYYWNKKNNDKTHGNVFETLFVSMRICLVN